MGYYEGSKMQERDEDRKRFEKGVDKKPSQKKELVVSNFNDSEAVNKFAIEALSVLHKVLHALQHSNMKGTILHNQISEVIKMGMNCPLKIQK